MIYKINEEAEKDLIEIAIYGDTNFGIAQSNKYSQMLNKRFEQIANSPLMYPDIDHISKGYRRSICGVHSIYYKIYPNFIGIMRIIKGQQVSARSLQ